MNRLDLIHFINKNKLKCCEHVEFSDPDWQEKESIIEIFFDSGIMKFTLDKYNQIQSVSLEKERYSCKCWLCFLRVLPDNVSLQTKGEAFHAIKEARGDFEIAKKILRSSVSG